MGIMAFKVTAFRSCSSEVLPKCLQKLRVHLNATKVAFQSYIV